MAIKNRTTENKAILITGVAAVMALAAILVFLLVERLMGAGRTEAGGIQNGMNPGPSIIPAVSEWIGYSDNLEISGFNTILIEDEALEPLARQLAGEIEQLTDRVLTVQIGSFNDRTDNMIALGLQSDENKAGSYECEIDFGIVMLGSDEDGLFWGTRTLLQLFALGDDIPKGRIIDTPEFEVRGLGIDVARKPMSIDTLKQIIVMMSWYKMNDLQIHLNDNALMVYSDKTGSVEEAFTAYSAFRLESTVANGAGQTITATDYSYTMEEFRELIDFAGEYHVNIVPEFDTPAHSLAITSVFQDLAIKETPGSVDKIDIENPATLQLVQRIWEEYLGGEQPLFSECGTVHVGLDEAYQGADAYYHYSNAMIEYIKEHDKKVRIWGSLTSITSDVYINSENVQMNIWKTSWANPETMLLKGFDLINTLSGSLYLIPAGGYDYLDTRYLYESYVPNQFEADDSDEVYVIDYDTPQLLGASMFVWNDFCDNLDMGITEYDIFVRIEDAMPYFAQKVWGSVNTATYEEFTERMEQTAEIPGCRFSQGNSVQDYFMKGNSMPGNSVQGNESVDADTSENAVLVPSYEISFEVDLTGDLTGNLQEGITLFANPDTAYGLHQVRINEAGKLELTQEYKTWEFDYIVPEDEAVNIRLAGEIGTTSLYVNGGLIQTVGSNAPQEYHATFLFPLQYVNEAVISDVSLR